MRRHGTAHGGGAGRAFRKPEQMYWKLWRLCTDIAIIRTSVLDFGFLTGTLGVFALVWGSCVSMNRRLAGACIF